MRALPFSAPIEKTLEWWVNGEEVLAALPPTTAIVRPSEQGEQLIYSKNPQTGMEEQIIFSANTTVVFAGPGGNDWRQVITGVYDRDGHVVYETDITPYLEESNAARERYMRQK